MTQGPEIRVWYTCDHCRRRARVDALVLDSPQDLADRCAEAHAIAEPDCHASRGPSGLRINATGAEPPSLWEM